VAVAHLTFDLGARDQRRDAVQHDDVQRATAHQRLGDLQRLLGRVGLGNVQVLDVDADPRRVARIERVLHVDERADAAALLGLGDGVQADRGLARAFRPVDFGDAPARDAPYTDRDIHRERSGRDRVHVHVYGVTQANDGPVSEPLGEIGHCRL